MECHKRFVSKTHLRSHSDIHLTNRPYKCTFKNCTKSYSKLNRLQTHLRTHVNSKILKWKPCRLQRKFSNALLLAAPSLSMRKAFSRRIWGFILVTNRINAPTLGAKKCTLRRAYCRNTWKRYMGKSTVQINTQPLPSILQTRGSPDLFLKCPLSLFPISNSPPSLPK